MCQLKEKFDNQETYSQSISSTALPISGMTPISVKALKHTQNKFPLKQKIK